MFSFGDFNAIRHFMRLNHPSCKRYRKESAEEKKDPVSSSPSTSPQSQLPFRAVLLDDNPNDRDHVRAMLRRHPSIQLAGEATTLKQALEMISQKRIDVMFLESEIKGRFILEECPLIPAAVKLIFLTNHQMAAVRAFELEALDFLLKPLSSSRLNETIRRLLRIDWQRTSTPPLLKTDNNASALIPFERGRRGASLSEISLIQAFGNYTRVTFDKGKSEIVLRSLAKWEQLLPMPPFLRVHRNAVVHTNKVRALDDINGCSVLRLDNNKETIPVSRRCLPEVRQALFAQH